MITLNMIRDAAQRIQDIVIQTPLTASATLSRMFNARVYLKLENLQVTGSFKIRGAVNKLFKCRDQIGTGGVVAASAGNHAQGVALAAREVGIPATIVMPEGASISKQEATRGYGGKVVIHGTSVGESLAYARELAQTGMTFIHPFDDPDIIAGQGVIGLELQRQLKSIDLIISPVGGGGLIAGIAAAVKAFSPQTKIIGVQARNFPSAYEALRQGAIATIDAAGSSLADGISVKRTGDLNFTIIRQLVDEIVLVGEEQIAAAILLLLERKKILAEGAGATPLAALISHAVSIPPDATVVLIISGGNVDSLLLGRIINKGLVTNGRFMRVKVYLSDTPGSLAQLLNLVARQEANVLHIYHNRSEKGLPINFSCVELELETRSHDHIQAVTDQLNKAGYAVQII